MALEVILNSVALSVTCLIFSPMSPTTRIPSSSDKDLCVWNQGMDERRRKGIAKQKEWGVYRLIINTSGGQTRALQ